MAITRSRNAIEVALEAGRTFFHHKREQMRAARTRSKNYRVAFHELSALTDRDLSDLGIARCDIKRLALEAANGC